MQNEDRIFVATLRATFRAPSEVDALVIADQIRLNGEADLDEEDGDELEVTQVTSNGLELSPDELLLHLRKARNLLIKTRKRACYDLARELDKVIFSLNFHDEPGFTESGYDYGHFMELAEAILVRGEEPNVGA